MPSHDPLLSDRTEDKDADMAVVVEDSPQKNANTALTITFVSTALYLDILRPIVPPYPILDLAPILGHKAADYRSDKSIPFQKKGWRNCHSKTKAE